MTIDDVRLTILGEDGGSREAAADGGGGWREAETLNTDGADWNGFAL
ncbi:MAG: hypothetical protein ACKO9S_12600 [Bacteroidota bacterium]